MRNWSIDEGSFDHSSDEYHIWRLEQLINFGLTDEKLDRNLLLKYWTRIDIDPERRKYLAFLLDQPDA